MNLIVLYVVIIMLVTISNFYFRSIAIYFEMLAILILKKDDILKNYQGFFKTILLIGMYYIISIISLITVTKTYDYLVFVPPIEGGVGQPMPDVSGLEYAWKIIDRAVISPIFEEVFFRRFLIGYFSDRGINTVLLCTVSVLLFTLAHCQFGPWNIFFKFFTTYIPGSIILTIVFLRSGLIAAIGLHAFWNFTMSV